MVPVAPLQQVVQGAQAEQFDVPVALGELVAVAGTLDHRFPLHVADPMTRREAQPQLVVLRNLQILSEAARLLERLRGAAARWMGR